MSNKFIAEIMSDSSFARERHQELMTSFSVDLLKKVRPLNNNQEALQEGFKVVNQILANMEKLGISLMNMDPGHGPGHLAKDCLNGLALFDELTAEPAEIFIGFVGGSLHDLGTALIDRYAEAHRVIRHAEAGGLLVDYCLTSDLVNEAERLLIVYVISAHTHYLRTIEIKNEQGEIINKIEPYIELYPDGKPFWPVWFTRWVDRLDCSGPCFVGRHYLTTVSEHKDFDGSNFYDVSFAKHMRPLLRDQQTDGKTMAEHLRMFANSQNNESPYGKFDFGNMVKVRDEYKEMLLSVVELFNSEMTEDEIKAFLFSQDEILLDWNEFLLTKIEFSEKAPKTVENLDKMFRALPEETRAYWLRAFAHCVKIYEEKWVPLMRSRLGNHRDLLVLPILGDLEKRI